jgi:hypothetical protein
MISLLCSLGRKSLPLLAVLIVSLLAATIQAQTIKLTNTAAVPIVIEPISSAGGLVYPGKPFELKPGQSAGIMLPGDKAISLRDPMGTRVLQKFLFPPGPKTRITTLSLVLTPRVGPCGRSSRAKAVWARRMDGKT